MIPDVKTRVTPDVNGLIGSNQKDIKYMRLFSLIEVIVAAHISKTVQSDFKERGGIMLVAPPGSLKSTIIKASLDNYPDALILSDINVQTLNPMRDDIAAEKINTLAFPALEKIYERHNATASNIEGTIKALVAEGFREASFEDHRMLGCFEARCQITAAIIPALYRRKFTEWQENGFLRRFLWCFYQMSDPHVLIKAIHEWRKIEFENEIPLQKIGGRIPFNVTERESEQLLQMLKYQHGKEVPYVMLKKILSVLKWRHRTDENLPMKILKDFAQCLQSQPAKLEIDSFGPEPPKKRKPRKPILSSKTKSKVTK